MVAKEEQKTATQLELFIDNLPKKPYCTDNLEYGLMIRPKAIAITKKTIQHNKPAEIRWLVFDCDYVDALGKISSKNLPMPNIYISNPQNGHSHIFYGLTVPVVRTDAARAAPLKYLAAIEYALCEALEADVGYSGLVAKNPLHKHWRTTVFVENSYELSQLAECLTLPIKIPKKAQVQGAGRNCTIFETVKLIAYANVLKFKIESTKEAFDSFILGTCQSVNAGFPVCLDIREVQGIAKSISRWTWRHYTKKWTDEKFSEIQARRGKAGGLKSGTTRASKNEEKRATALQMSLAGFKLKEIAEALEVPLSTIGRWCKK